MVVEGVRGGVGVFSSSTRRFTFFFNSFFFVFRFLVTLAEVMIKCIFPLNVQPGYTPKCLLQSPCVRDEKKNANLRF